MDKISQQQLKESFSKHLLEEAGKYPRINPHVAAKGLKQKKCPRCKRNLHRTGLNRTDYYCVCTIDLIISY